MKRASLGQSEAAENSTGGAKYSLAEQPCPNAPLCRRWNATDGGAYCRLCWRDYTHPKPLRIVEGRA